MRLSVYAVHDSISVSFGTPFFCLSEGNARRALIDGYAGRPGAPGDFVLYELGTYETDDASFHLTQVPSRVCSLSELVKG